MHQEAYNHFYESFIVIGKALEIIAYDLYKDKISDIFKDNWDRSSKARASYILNGEAAFQRCS